MSPAPLPPDELIRRVGWEIHHASSPTDVYEQRGLLQWRLIKSLLPEGWSVEGKRVLDFGCGAGRVLRSAVAEDPGAELWGCDLHAPSIAWLAEHLCPPAHVFQTGESPPTTQPDGHFDLIYAFSVFTHLTDQWSGWLAELHRLLADDGLLVVTVFGPGHTSFGVHPVSEEVIGMNVFSPSATWDEGGPLLIHSEWWLHAHWGRAFEILELRHGDPAGPPPLFGQGVVVMRRRPGTVTAAELERCDPDEPRELAALRENVASLSREITEHTTRFKVHVSSRSWKMTAPLRKVGAATRRWRSGAR
jgi:SAM-dependent methyltransferase